MKKTALASYDLSQKEPILVVDKIGLIGEKIANEYSKDFQVVFLTKNPPDERNKNVIYIPFNKNIPKAPNAVYKKMFLVDDGEAVTRDSVFSFIDLARASSSQVFFIGSIRNIDVKHADELTSGYSKLKILVIGDLFDKNIFFDSNDSINRFILGARKNKHVEVKGSGLSLSYPITFDDTIKLLVKATYLNIPQNVILLFNEHPITDISLANIFKKVNPDISVDFIKDDNKKREIYIPRNSQNAINKYDLESRIKDLDLENPEDRELKIILKKNDKSKNILKAFIFSVLVFLFIFLLPLFTTFSYMKLAERELNASWEKFEQNKIEESTKHVRNSKSFFETAEKTSKPFILQTKLINKEVYSREVSENIEHGKNLSNGLLSLLSAKERLDKINKENLSDKKKEFEEISNLIEEGIYLIQKSKAENYPSSEMGRRIDSLLNFLNIFANSSEVLPEILGFDEEKKYLIIFQNNLMLRPGGGKIEAYGMLTVKDGRVAFLEIKSSDYINNKLTARVEPEFSLRRYGDKKLLTFSDSNYDPDFVRSAIKSSEIFSLSTKEDIDGVVGMDLIFAKNLLSIFDNQNVSGQLITSKNIYQKSYEELKKPSNEYMFTLANSIEKNIRSQDEIPVLSLIDALGKSINDKNLIFAFKNPEIQNIFSANGWSSSLYDNRKNTKNLINDYFGISESNLGSESNNSFISRSLSKKIIVLDSGKITSRVSIVYKNNLTTGSYKVYLKYIVPEGAKLTEVLIDGKQEKIVDSVTNPDVYERLGFRSPQGVEVEGQTYLGKNIFGMYVEVPPSKTKNISILYEIPFTLSRSEKETKYSLYIFKQPGIESYPFDVSFSLPNDMRVVMQKNESQIEVNSDKILNVSFIKN